jgi:hypothetical protein
VLYLDALAAMTMEGTGSEKIPPLWVAVKLVEKKRSPERKYGE